MSESGEESVYQHKRNGSAETSCPESDAEDLKSYTSLTNETDSGVSNTGSIDLECIPHVTKNGMVIIDEDIISNGNGGGGHHTSAVPGMASENTDNETSGRRLSVQHETTSHASSNGMESKGGRFAESAPSTPNGSLGLPSRTVRQQRSASPPHQQSQMKRNSPSTSSLVFGKHLKKSQLNFTGSTDVATQSMVAASSTTGLILQGRPRELPAKSPEEDKRHKKMYKEIVAAARRKEVQKAKDELKKEVDRREKDKQVAASLVEWNSILANWERMHARRNVQELWWKGLPPGVRGKVWMKAIGNDLNITHELYQIFLSRSKTKMAEFEKAGVNLDEERGIDREHSLEVIGLDALRTFPNLGFFQEGGPFYDTLHDVLGAYACYRPDIGYVQGMSFLAAVLLLNLEASDAFICLANLLNRPSYLAFFKVDHALMKPYFDTYTLLLQENLPRLSAHFSLLQFCPELYLIEWIFTLYTKVLPLDTSCRVWDVFCRDGDSFLFRTALGILKLCQKELMEFEAIAEAGHFLSKFACDISSEVLFDSIGSIPLSAKHFQHILQQQLGSSR